MQENQWLKGILGEFQGYINEVKQNAQAQGINADFLDLQDGVLNHRAVMGDTPLLLNPEDLNNPYANIDDSGMKIGGKYSEGYLYFRSVSIVKQFIENFKVKYLEKTRLILTYDEKLVPPYYAVTNYIFESEGKSASLTGNFNPNTFEGWNLKSLQVIIKLRVGIRYNTVDSNTSLAALTALDLGHELFVHIENAMTFFDNLQKEIALNKLPSLQLGNKVINYFIKDQNGKSKEQREHAILGQRGNTRYNTFQEQLLKLIQNSQTRQRIQREIKDEIIQYAK